jgi:hypothetical protein
MKMFKDCYTLSRSIYMLSLFILIFGCSLFVSGDNGEGEWLYNYYGDIAEKCKIGMTLIYQNDEVHGVYFYKKTKFDLKSTIAKIM